MREKYEDLQSCIQESNKCIQLSASKNKIISSDSLLQSIQALNFDDKTLYLSWLKKQTVEKESAANKDIIQYALALGLIFGIAGWVSAMNEEPELNSAHVIMQVISSVIAGAFLSAFKPEPASLKTCHLFFKTANHRSSPSEINSEKISMAF